MLKEYFSIKKILAFEIDGYTNRYWLEGKTRSNNWIFKVNKGTTKPLNEYHISNFPQLVVEQIASKLLVKSRASNNIHNLDTVNKSIQIAYTRFEIIHYVTN